MFKLGFKDLRSKKVYIVRYFNKDIIHFYDEKKLKKFLKALKIVQIKNEWIFVYEIDIKKKDVIRYV